MKSKAGYRSLTFDVKRKIVDAIEAGEKKSKVAAEFDIPRSTLSTIWKNRHEIPSNESRSSRMRIRKTEHPAIENSVLQWFQQCRRENVPVSGALIKEKALWFAAQLKINDFKASDGWLDKFKKRHQIIFRKLAGESASVNEDVCEDWKEELAEILKDHKPENVFNADETGLFFKCLPNSSMVFKDEKCHGGKHSKERISVLLAANMDGSQKLKPLVIGKSNKPRCFKGIKSFPVTYRANKKAWMTHDLFTEWLIDLNADMKRQKRKIAMFIDNCSAHNDPPALSHVQVIFLPPNTTSKLQPLDQGIIKVFKGFYRSEIVKKLLQLIDEGKSDEMSTAVNLYEAIVMLNKAWRNVSATTIRNCFKTCGFVTPITPEDNVDEEQEGEDDIPVSLGPSQIWNKFVNQGSLTTDISFNDFVNFDDNVAAYGILTDAEIMSMNTQEECDDDDPDEVDPIPTISITCQEAASSLATLKQFLVRTDIDDRVFHALVMIENSIDKERWGSCTQKKITDFFRKPEK